MSEVMVGLQVLVLLAKLANEAINLKKNLVPNKQMDFFKSIYNQLDYWDLKDEDEFNKAVKLLEIINKDIEPIIYNNINIIPAKDRIELEKPLNVIKQIVDEPESEEAYAFCSSSAIRKDYIDEGKQLLNVIKKLVK